MIFLVAASMALGCIVLVGLLLVVGSKGKPSD